MFEDFPIHPEAASTVANQIDVFYFFLVGLSAVMAILIALAIIVFSIKYRRRSAMEIPPVLIENKIVEITWIVVPFIVFMAIFVWSAWLFFDIQRMPAETMDVNVVAKQWMWKFQHPTGQTEINDLHVPVGQPVRLVMISQDVIHNFFVPEFRVHTDVLPNRYRYQWFEATKPGVYNLFCSEYCGTEHSKMIGKVYVMEQSEYETWLAGGATGSAADQGGQLFQKFACNTCHSDTASARGPSLTGVFGDSVTLSTGEVVTVDEGYIRESILNPRAKIVQGYDAIMPSFQGQLSEEQVLQLIAYIKSLDAPRDQIQPVETAPAERPSSPAGDTGGVATPTGPATGTAPQTNTAQTSTGETR